MLSCNGWFAKINKLIKYINKTGISVPWIRIVTYSKAGKNFILHILKSRKTFKFHVKFVSFMHMEEWWRNNIEFKDFKTPFVFPSTSHTLK